MKCDSLTYHKKITVFLKKFKRFTFLTKAFDIMKFKSFILFIFFILFAFISFAQKGANVEDIKKPEKYENRKLGSEKSAEKKFTLTRKIYQNTVTHYNYYFNANNKMQDVISSAKLQHIDDYTQLLPFYNYSLDATATNSSELDSIIYKCTAGILLHDLRNDWIDNLYILLGKAYFFKKDFDSAGITWQYLNYAFAPKDEGYDIPIGSNSSNNTGTFSIATEEKSNFFKKLVSHPPSRNQSFIWIIRNYIEQNLLTEASGLIQILKNDPNFPKRLKTDLNEVIAYWNYKQQHFDSAAHYLSKAIDNASNKSEEARWLYLIAQMYQESGDNINAVKFYEKSIKKTYDPIMDVYARLNAIQINESGKKNYLQENINELLKMARKSKYVNYRDIIYYAVASIEIQRNNLDNAQTFLEKSIANSTTNKIQKNKSFLKLADMNFLRKKYIFSYNNYDSIDINSIPLQPDKNRVMERKPPLKIISENIITIQNEDSLQWVASLSIEKRDAFIKNVLKKLRKEKGLKEEESGNFNPAVKQDAAADLFEQKQGDFYFYNSSLKSKGYSEFISTWGKRPNVDNWRRQSALDKQLKQQSLSDVDDTKKEEANTKDSKKSDDGTDILSFDALLNKLPLTVEKLQQSNRTIMDAFMVLGRTYQSKIEDIPSAIEAYEELLKRFPNSTFKEEILFNLIYCYNKVGSPDKSLAVKRQLQAEFKQGKYTFKINNPTAFQPTEKESPVTLKYKEIYNLFIEGQFEKAKDEKRIADSLYGSNNWTPQLLFIESIYYIKQREDSTTINKLTQLKVMFSNHALAEKATTMIDVLSRRKEIENYLSQLETSTQNTTSVNKPINTKVEDKIENSTKKEETKLIKKEEIDENKIKENTTIETSSIYKVNATSQHYVVIVLDKVDEVFVSEAKNAFNRYNREKYYNQKIDLQLYKLNEQIDFILQGPFSADSLAIDYVEKTRPFTASRILPWLVGEKYSYLIINNENLEILKKLKDIKSYKEFINNTYPNKF